MFRVVCLHYTTNAKRKTYILDKSYYFMPIITISTYSGRTQREKDRLAEAITDDVVKIFDIERKDIIIVFQEEPHGNWYAEGIRL
jgi:4-oxalocrotonate tautomerase